MAGPEDIYHALILAHSREPRNMGPLPDADRAAARDNPLCGDRCRVAVKLAGETIADVRFEGVGCAISLASASMMTERARGTTPDQVAALFRIFDGMLGGATSNSELSLADLGDLAAFAAVAKLPVRAKCARLPWQALLAALHRGEPIPE
jgi:nitrogen fixation protein NifU and related proteins